MKYVAVALTGLLVQGCVTLKPRSDVNLSIPGALVNRDYLVKNGDAFSDSLDRVVGHVAIKVDDPAKCERMLGYKIDQCLGLLPGFLKISSTPLIKVENKKPAYQSIVSSEAGGSLGIPVLSIKTDDNSVVELTIADAARMLISQPVYIEDIRSILPAGGAGGIQSIPEDRLYFVEGVDLMTIVAKNFRKFSGDAALAWGAINVAGKDFEQVDQGSYQEVMALVAYPISQYPSKTQGLTPTSATIKAPEKVFEKNTGVGFRSITPGDVKNLL